MSADPWLDLIDPVPRRALLALTAVCLVLGTGLSGLAAPGVQDALALAVVLGLAGLWVGAWAGLGRPALARRRAERLAEADLWARDRGLLVSSVALPPRSGIQALVERDPAFSLPVLHEIVLALHRTVPGAAHLVHGPVRILDVWFIDDRTHLFAQVGTRGPDASVFWALHLSRPDDAVSGPPDGGVGAWRLESADEVEVTAEPPIRPDPGMPAARRALLMRAEAFDLDAFEAMVAEIDAALDAAAASPAAVEPYATAAGAACVRWWVGEGMPPSGDRTEWLSVEEDGWTERIEVRRGARVLGLRRTSGQPDAAWRLWRLRSAS